MSNEKVMKRGRRFSCPSCGGGLRYDIAKSKMKCDHCEKTIEMYELPDDPPADAPETMEVSAYRCPQCGAEIYSADYEATAFCSFCGSDVVLTEKIGRIQKPEAVLPFKITREQCEAAYLNELKPYFLAPHTLASAKTLAHFRPVYIPFWSSSVHAEGEVNLVGSKGTADKTGRSVHEYRLSDSTSTLKLNADITQKGILNDASTAIEDEVSAMLKYTEKGSVPFHSGYLSGIYAVAPDIPAETYKEETKWIAVRNLLYKVKDRYHLDSVELRESESYEYGLPNPCFQEKLIMIPVWLLTYREGKRLMHTAVNGLTGKVVCDIPVSLKRMTALIAAIAAVLSCLMILIPAINPDLMITLCAAMTFGAQFLFYRTLEDLELRKSRAYDPDLSGKRNSRGPAKALLYQYGNGYAAVGKKRTAEQEYNRKYGKLDWIVPGVIFGGLLIGYLFIWGIFYAVCMFAALIAMIILQKMYGHAMIYRVLAIVACGAGIINLLIGSEVVSCCCMAVMVLSAVWELILVNSSRNEYASRPVPFLKDQEENS